MDFLEKVVADERRRLDDYASTTLARLGSHTHAHTHTPEIPAGGTDNHVLTSVSSAPTWAQPIATSVIPANPYTGQLLAWQNDMVLYRWNGTGWTAFAAMGGTTSATRHEARYEATHGQSINSSTDTKVQFPTTAYNTGDITPSGTNNTDFAIGRGGVWMVSATVRANGSGADDITFFLSTGTSTATLTNRFAMQGVSIEGTSAMALCVATTIRLTTSDSVFAGFYQNSGVALGLDTVFGKTNHIAFTWLRS